MKRTPQLLAIVHALLLAVFTMPADLVPARIRYWSQAYAGVLFHQDWRLFAPDPPACACVLEATVADGDTVGLAGRHDHFIWRRMSANACRYVEAAMAGGEGPVPPVLASSLRGMAGPDATVQVQWRRMPPCRGVTPVPLERAPQP